MLCVLLGGTTYSFPQFFSDEEAQEFEGGFEPEGRCDDEHLLEASRVTTLRVAGSKGGVSE